MISYNYASDDKLFLIDGNALVKHKITDIRDINTKWDAFWQNIEDVTLYMIFTFMEEEWRRTHGLPLIPTYKKDITTGNNRPAKNMSTMSEAPESLIFSLFRGGTPMANAFLRHIPNASVIHAVYGSSLPADPKIREQAEKRGGRWITEMKNLKRDTSLEGKNLYIIDPVIGTGRSMVAILDYLEEFHNVTHNLNTTTLFSLSAHQDGLSAIREKYRDIGIVLTNVEDGMDERGFLVPGFGDVGERCFHSS